MSVLVFAYHHCEDIELVATADVLRRAGAKVTVFGETDVIQCGNGTKVKVDTVKEPAALADCLVFPGGPGAGKMEENHAARQLCEKYKAAGKLICAICAAPAVLARWGVYAGQRVCGYPGYVSDKAQFVEERVVVGDWYVTARGPGVSMEFGVAIADKMGLDGKAVEKGTLMK